MPDTMFPITDRQLVLTKLRQIQAECTSGIRAIKTNQNRVIQDDAAKHVLWVISEYAADAEAAFNRMYSK